MDISLPQIQADRPTVGIADIQPPFMQHRGCPRCRAETRMLGNFFETGWRGLGCDEPTIVRQDQQLSIGDND